MDFAQAIQMLLIGSRYLTVIVKGSGLPGKESSGAGQPGIQEFWNAWMPMIRIISYLKVRASGSIISAMWLFLKSCCPENLTAELRWSSMEGFLTVYFVTLHACRLISRGASSHPMPA